MTGKWLKLLNALLLTTAFFLGANLAYKLNFLFFEAPFNGEAALPEEPLPAANSHQSLSEYLPIIDRNPASTAHGKSAEPDKIDAATLKKADLELRLLGTVSVDSGRKFAVLEESASGRQHLYCEGRRIQQAVLQKIFRGKVVLLVNGRKEVLEVDKSRRVAEIKETEQGGDNEARRTDLMEAVNQGRREKVVLLLAQGADVNARDSYGNTALILAARSGRSDIVRLLIDNGADVHQKDNVGNTPLIDSARYASESAIDVMELLIAEGADVQAKNIYSNTALMNAVRRGQIEVVELLLREGADINTRSKNGQTPLKLATDSLRKDVIAMLTDYGAMQHN